MNTKFYKLIIIDRFLKETSALRQHFIENAVDTAIDDTLFMRRVRVLRQLSEFESQALKKIYNFDTDDIDDFFEGLDLLLLELKSVTLKNA